MARQLPPPQADPYAELAELLRSMGPDELEAYALHLPPEDRAILSHVLGTELDAGWRRDPATFAAHFDQAFKVYRYVQLLADEIAAAFTGSATRLLISLPGRYGKTTLLRWALAWALDRDHTSRSIFVSYGDALALETGAAVRDTLLAHHDELGVTLQRGRRERDRWLTPEGGGLLAAGIRTGITGYGCSRTGALIVDDPFKGWTEAHRETERNDIAERFKGTLRNRLDDEDAGIVVVHHRLHVDDLIGRLLGEAEDGTGDAWRYVALPAIAPDPEVARAAGRVPLPDPLGREPGEVIEPDRFDLPAVQGRHRGLGSTYLVSALEQQDPQPAEGKELLREWFVLAEAAEMPRTPELAVTSWDLKLKDREAGDFVVGQVWWRVAGAFWLVDQIRGGYDHATTANAIALLAVRHPEVKTHHIEYAASADEVMPMLRKPQPGYTVSDEMARRLGMTPAERDAVQTLRRKGMARLQGSPPKGDKSVRARAFIAPQAEPGNVRLPADAPWLAALLDELTAFPDGEHDDQVDAMSLGLSKLAKGAATAKAPSGQVTQARPGASRSGPVTAAVPRPGRSVAAAPRGGLPRRLGR